jgi:hypothetical protein
MSKRGSTRPRGRLSSRCERCAQWPPLPSSFDRMDTLARLLASRPDTAKCLAASRCPAARTSSAAKDETSSLSARQMGWRREGLSRGVSLAVAHMCNLVSIGAPVPSGGRRLRRSGLPQPGPGSAPRARHGAGWVSKTHHCGDLSHPMYGMSHYGGGALRNESDSPVQSRATETGRIMTNAHVGLTFPLWD